VALFLITKTRTAKQYGFDQDKTKLIQNLLKNTVIIRISSTDFFFIPSVTKGKHNLESEV